MLAPVAHDRPRTFAFRGHQILVRENDLALPDAAALKALEIPGENVLPVGLLDGEYCCAAWLPAGVEPPAGYAFKGLRALFGRLDETALAVAGRAFQIADWARTHRFCGACGAKMSKADGERAMKCPACGHVAYPRIAPAMMVLVRKGAAILLARNAAVPAGPGSLMIAFTAEHAGGEITPDPTEIAEAHWFGPGDTLPELPPHQSISRSLIEANLPK